MKLKLSFALVLSSMLSWAQYAPSYYDNVDLKKTGTQLFDDLSTTIKNTHKKNTSYDGLRDLLPKSDVDPTNSKNIILFYGSESSGIHQRSRGNANSNWNREHVFPKSQGNPNLGESGPGADGHHLRPTDITLNSQRGNTPFADGYGAKAGNMNGGWYPGDEWKGDVARIIMYMYLRYGDRCDPTVVGVGTKIYNSNIPDIFLKWNAEDPISEFEINRNKIVSDAQGNSNPFIDNPYLATLIWGGPEAENTWPSEFDTTPDTEKPTIPTNLQISNLTAYGASFNWNKSSDNIGVVGYDVYLNGNIIGSPSTNSFKASSLNPNTEYQLFVIAKDRAGNISESSSVLTFTTPEAEEENPNPGTGENSGMEDFEKIPTASSSYNTVEWTNNGINWTATKARTDQTINNRAITMNEGGILKSSTIQNGIGKLTMSFKNPFSTDSNLSVKVLYNENGVAKEKVFTYKVTTATQTETMTFNISQPFTFEITTVEKTNKNRVTIDDLIWSNYTLSTTEISKSNQIKVYPNPIKNQEFTINGINKNDIISVYSITGQLVQTFNNVQDNQKLILKKLPKGIYIIKTSNSSTKVIVD